MIFLQKTTGLGRTRRCIPENVPEYLFFNSIEDRLDAQIEEQGPSTFAAHRLMRDKPDSSSKWL